jgi:Flp pilus assembly pilin Flp
MSNYYRNNTKGLNTGFKVETVPGTLETLTQTEFTGDWDAGLIQPKQDIQKLKISAGTTKLVPGKLYGEIQNFKIPLANGTESGLIAALGAVVTVGTTTTTYDVGGKAWDTTTLNGRLATTSLTVGQYDGKEYLTLSGARPSSFKIGAKVGEILFTELNLQGNFAKSNSVITYFQEPSASFNLNVLKGDALTINSIAYEYTDFEIDFKPTLKIVESGSASSGVSAYEIVDIDPQITITVYPGDPATGDLYTLLTAGTVVPLSWTATSAVTSNSYTVTGSVQLDSGDASYDNNLQVRKLVLIPVYNSANPYQLRISVT